MSEKPEIRFQGNTEPWEQRKLSECLSVATRRNSNSYSKEDVLSVSDEYGCVNQIQFQGRSFAGNDISNYKIVEDGDIIYTRSPLQAKPYGIIKVMRGNPGIVSPLYIVNKPTDGNDSEFLYRVFDTPAKTNNYLCPLVRKGAKNTMNVSEEEWLSGSIIVAPAYDEQHKIGEFFNQLDHLITLHQRKLSSLRSCKSALLLKMFPSFSKDGKSRVPEVRFRGFEGEWEEKRFSELFTRNSKKNGSTYGKDKTISVASMAYNADGSGASAETLSNYSLISIGDIAFEGHRNKNYSYGRFVLNDIGDGIISPIFVSFSPIVEMDVQFWKYYIHNEMVMQPILNQSTKSGIMMHKLVVNDFLDKSILVPSLPEQRAIGAFFASLDRKIEGMEKKIEAMKEMKEACLGKMFPKTA